MSHKEKTYDFVEDVYFDLRIEGITEDDLNHIFESKELQHKFRAEDLEDDPGRVGIHPADSF